MSDTKTLAKVSSQGTSHGPISDKTLSKMSHDARKAVLAIRQTEETIATIRNYEPLEYVNYVGKVEVKSAKKMMTVTGLAFACAFSGALTFDVIDPALETLGIAGILGGGATGMISAYQGSAISTLLSPLAMNKAKKKQAIEDRVHHLFHEQKKAEEQDALNGIQPLITELNYSLKKINREIYYAPATGKFFLTNANDSTHKSAYRQEFMQSVSLPKWDSIYILATAGGIKMRTATLPFAIVHVTPELLQRKNLSIEESIAILRFTEKAIKEELSNTSTGEGHMKTTEPSDHKYIREENRLVSKAQNALETLNRAIHPAAGKLVYSSGTRFPNFNLSKSTGDAKHSKWEMMEQAFTETMTLGRITSLKALEMPKAPKTTDTP
jgi:hypothetical protein